MTDEPYGKAARLADAIQRRGARIILRQVSRTDGPVPLLNPPRITSATIAGDVVQGATVLALEAAYAVGRLLPGDRMLVAGVSLAVSAPSAARPATTPGFAAVQIQPAPTAISAGMPVAFAFAADLATYAMIDSFPVQLVDESRIRSRDLSVQISGFQMPDEIPPTWSVILGSREMSIVSAVPTYAQDEIVSWTIQAR